MHVAALVDTGSSINVISKNLYDSIPEQFKLSFKHLSSSEIRLANNQLIRIEGVASLQIQVPQGTHIVEVYILRNTSHPLILGTNYLRENNIVLDFSNFSSDAKSVSVQTQKRLTIEPNSELIVYGKVPNYVTHGLNGICSNSKFAVNKGLMVAKCLVTVPYNQSPCESS